MAKVHSQFAAVDSAKAFAKMLPAKVRISLGLDNDNQADQTLISENEAKLISTFTNTKVYDIKSTEYWDNCEMVMALLRNYKFMRISKPKGSWYWGIYIQTTGEEVMVVCADSKKQKSRITDWILNDVMTVE